MPRAVTFDLWHTLLLLAPDAEERYLELHPQVVARVVSGWPKAPGPAPDPALNGIDLARTAFGMAIGRERRGEGTPLSRVATDLATLSGRRSRPEELVRALDRLVAELPFEETPGARTVLAALSAKGYRLGVVSNLVGESGAAMRRVAERLEMSPYVQAWALSEELPAAKPSPAIFDAVLASLGVSPSEAIHVGDMPADIEGARRAGLRAGVLYTGGKRYSPTYRRLHQPDGPLDPPAEYVISQWSELPPLVERLFSAR